MRFRPVLSLSLIAGVAGVLLAPNAVRNAHHPQAHKHAAYPLPIQGLLQHQKTFTSEDAGGPPGPKFSVREQDESLCRAGSRQWTGWIHVSEEKSLFFCKQGWVVMRASAYLVSRVL